MKIYGTIPHVVHKKNGRQGGKVLEGNRFYDRKGKVLKGKI